MRIAHASKPGANNALKRGFAQTPLVPRGSKKKALSAWNNAQNEAAEQPQSRRAAGKALGCMLADHLSTRACEILAFCKGALILDRTWRVSASYLSLLSCMRNLPRLVKSNARFISTDSKVPGNARNEDVASYRGHGMKGAIRGGKPHSRV